MKNEKYSITKKEIDLGRIEDSLSDPALTLLFREGWTVFAAVPVEDGGRPKLILFLKPNDEEFSEEKSNNLLRKTPVILIIQTFILLIILVLFAFNSYI